MTRPHVYKLSVSANFMEPYLFEVSSEAGRKIGGIYTVVKSKSRYVSEHFPNRYTFIGFYDELCSHEVKLITAPSEISKIFEELSTFGIYCHYGVWVSANNTPIILIDSKQFAHRSIQYEDDGQIRHDLQTNYIRFMLWKNFHIDSLMDHSYDFDENIVWGWAVGMLLERLCQISPYKDYEKIAHFHEWISSSGLLYSRLMALPLATVFTTHATVLGRSLSSAGVDVLQNAQNSQFPIDLSKSYEQKVEGKHQLEVEASKKAHVFSTVSQTVAQEVRYILGKYPDAILLNGLDFDHHAKESQFKNMSKYVRDELLELSESAFAPYYDARYDNALLLFTSGRYEFSNKGFDIYIKALAKLNQRLKEEGQKKSKQVIAFLFTPSSTRGPKLSAIKNYLLLDKINEVINSVDSKNSKKHYIGISDKIDDVLSDSIKNDLKIMRNGLIKESQNPPICLYELNYSNDDVINTCLACGLDNSASNPVKILFYPTYLKPNDGLLNMSYEDTISGMDMGVFASRYEPFGYTPLEAGIKRLMSVSTDFSGFGRYLQSKTDLSNRGVKILPLSLGVESAINSLADFLYEVYICQPSEIEQKKDDSYSLMQMFDWKDLISNYLQAYDLALKRAFTNDVQEDSSSVHRIHSNSVLEKDEQSGSFVMQNNSEHISSNDKKSSLQSVGSKSDLNSNSGSSGTSKSIVVSPHHPLAQVNNKVSIAITNKSPILQMLKKLEDEAQSVSDTDSLVSTKKSKKVVSKPLSLVSKRNQKSNHKRNCSSKSNSHVKSISSRKLRLSSKSNLSNKTTRSKESKSSNNSKFSNKKKVPNKSNVLSNKAKFSNKKKVSTKSKSSNKSKKSNNRNVLNKLQSSNKTKSYKKFNSQSNVSQRKSSVKNKKYAPIKSSRKKPHSIKKK